VKIRALAACAFIAVASLWSAGCGKSDVDVDVLDFEMPAAIGAEPPEAPGHVWAALRAEMCSNVGADDGVGVGVENWSLEMPDGRRISPADRAVPGSPSPTWEVGGVYMLSKDECASGWIMFAVPEEITPEAAIFTGPDDPKRISLP
jgi:hypothetical protein